LPLADGGIRLIDSVARGFDLMFLPTGVINVTIATRSRRNSMSENAIDSENISKPTDTAKTKRRAQSQESQAREEGWASQEVVRQAKSGLH
jgi:hypothetical protein